MTTTLKELDYRGFKLEKWKDNETLRTGWTIRDLMIVLSGKGYHDTLEETINTCDLILRE